MLLSTQHLNILYHINSRNFPTDLWLFLLSSRLKISDLFFTLKIKLLTIFLKTNYYITSVLPFYWSNFLDNQWYQLFFSGLWLGLNFSAYLAFAILCFEILNTKVKINKNRIPKGKKWGGDLIIKEKMEENLHPLYFPPNSRYNSISWYLF